MSQTAATASRPAPLASAQSPCAAALAEMGLPSYASPIFLLGIGGLWHSLFLQFKHLLPFLACPLLTFMAAPLQRRDESEAKSFANLLSAIETVNRIFRSRNRYAKSAGAAFGERPRVAPTFDLTGTIRLAQPDLPAGYLGEEKSLAPEARCRIRQNAMNRMHQAPGFYKAVRHTARQFVHSALGSVATNTERARSFPLFCCIPDIAPALCLWRPPPRL